MRTADDLGRELQASDERRLYDLIWKRTVASQMADPRIQRVRSARGHVDRGRRGRVPGVGRTIDFPGYLRAYVEGADDPDAELEDRETILPPLAGGRRRRLPGAAASGHTTQPPARFTEASLVKELEERGIGRPSTYASVIDTIVTSATTSGRRAPRWSPRGPRSRRCSCSSATSPISSTTSSPPTMEEALDAIARGEGEAEKWLHTFYFGNGAASAAAAELVSEDHLARSTRPR